MKYDLEQARYQAYRYGLPPSELQIITPAELNLYIKAKAAGEHEYWEILIYILTGQRPSKNYSIDDIESLL